MKLKAFVLVLALVGATVQAQDTTYYFVPNDGGSSLTASITLDAPFSPYAYLYPPYGSGFPWDIVNFSVSDPVATFTFADLQFGILPGPSLFNWIPSEIKEMDMHAYIPGADLFQGDIINFTTDGLTIEHQFNYDELETEYFDTGSWQAAPDAGSTVLLLGMALTGLATYRRFRQ